MKHNVITFLAVFIFLFFLKATNATSTDVTSLDLNFGNTSTFRFSIDCNSDFFGGYHEGQLIDYRLWGCFPDLNCFSVLQGSYVFKPDCFLSRDFNLFVYDDNVGFFLFDKLHYENEWNLRYKRFFQKVSVPLFSESIPFSFSFLSIAEPSFLWVFFVGLLLLFASFALLYFRNRWALPLMVLAGVLVVLGILFM